MMNSRQFAEIANERNINDGLPIIFDNIDSLAATNTNWQDEIFRKGMDPVILEDDSEEDIIFESNSSAANFKRYLFLLERLLISQASSIKLMNSSQFFMEA